MKTFFATCAVLLLCLSACANMAPLVSHPPDLTFDHIPEIRLNIASIDIVDQYKPPMQAPHVEHLLTSPLYESVHRLVAHQFVAGGAQDRLVVTIEDASIISKPLPRKEGVAGALTQEVSERYDGRAVVRVALYRDGQPDAVAGWVEATAERSSMLFEDMTPAERERLLFDVTEALANDIARSLENIVHEKMAEIVL